MFVMGQIDFANLFDNRKRTLRYLLLDVHKDESFEIVQVVNNMRENILSLHKIDFEYNSCLLFERFRMQSMLLFCRSQ